MYRASLFANRSFSFAGPAAEPCYAAPVSRRDVLQAALALPPEERAKLAGDILATLEPPPGVWCEDDPGFIEELERRATEANEHPERLVPAEEAFARIRARLRTKR